MHNFFTFSRWYFSTRNHFFFLIYYFSNFFENEMYLILIILKIFVIFCWNMTNFVLFKLFNFLKKFKLFFNFSSLFTFYVFWSITHICYQRSSKFEIWDTRCKRIRSTTFMTTITLKWFLSSMSFFLSHRYSYLWENLTILLKR